MTDKQLESIGLVRDGISSHPRYFKYWSNHLAQHISLPKNVSIDFAVNVLIDTAKEHGINIGRKSKIAEIKKCLEIE